MQPSYTARTQYEHGEASEELCQEREIELEQSKEKIRVPLAKVSWHVHSFSCPYGELHNLTYVNAYL